MAQQFNHIPDFFEIVGDELAKSVRRSSIIIGVLGIVAGVCLLIWPGKTLAVAAVILGIYFIVDAIVRAIELFRLQGISDGWRVLQIVLSVLLLIAGIFVLRAPMISGAWLALYLTIFIGISWIIEGIIAFATAATLLNPFWSVLYGVISVIAGVCVLVSPLWSTQVLMLFAAITAIVLGVFSLIRGATFANFLQGK